MEFTDGSIDIKFDSESIWHKVLAALISWRSEVTYLWLRHSCLRRAVSEKRKVRKFEKTEIHKMLLQGATEPFQTEWAAPVVFALKRESSPRFSVHYRNIKRCYGARCLPHTPHEPLFRLEWGSGSTPYARCEKIALSTEDPNWLSTRNDLN